MNKAILCQMLFLFFCIVSGSSQHKNILECMEIIGFNAFKYINYDALPSRWDTIIDVKAGYYEINYDFDVNGITKLCQVAKFNNSDGTILVGITGYYADGICSGHPSKFYEISKLRDSFLLVEQERIFPSLDFSMFFTNAKPIQALEKYLPEIREKYFNHLDTYKDSEATIKDLMEAIYDYHVIIPRKGTTAEVTLIVCDFDIFDTRIDELNIDLDEWDNAIGGHIGVVEFAYNRDLKQFRPILGKE
ncbi:MAG: hypothetical protein AAGG68_23010 [Bacteroidota bacterium]